MSIAAVIGNLIQMRTEAIKIKPPPLYKPHYYDECLWSCLLHFALHTSIFQCIIRFNWKPYSN